MAERIDKRFLSVKKKSRFCWSGFIVFVIGALQVVGGIALTVLSAGTLASVGMGLIDKVF